MILICLIGIDGAGKTTLSRNLVKRLNQEGIFSVYVYGRTVPILSRLLMWVGRNMFLKKNDLKKDYPEYTSAKLSMMKNPFLKWLYFLSVMIDYYLLIWFKLLLHVFRKEVIVLDRYLYDTVINDLAAHLNYSSDQTKEMINRGFRFLPIPDQTFLIDLDPQLAFSRKEDVVHISYLTDRRNRYLDLHSRPEIVVLSGEDKPDLIQKNILKNIHLLIFSSVK
jgi:thymidylate kinase